MTLDDDVALFLKEQSRLLNKPFKQVVNEVMRRGMSADSNQTSRVPFKVVPNHSGLVPGVDPQRLNQLNDELEAERFHREIHE